MNVNHPAIITQEETMAPTILPPQAFQPTPSYQQPFFHAPKKVTVQLNLYGVAAVPSTKKIHVPAYRKKDGTYVASHQRHVKLTKSSKPKKSQSNKHKQAKFPHPSHYSVECKASISLAYSLQIEEKQLLMKK